MVAPFPSDDVTEVEIEPRRRPLSGGRLAGTVSIGCGRNDGSNQEKLPSVARRSDWWIDSAPARAVTSPRYIGRRIRLINQATIIFS